MSNSNLSRWDRWESFKKNMINLPNAFKTTLLHGQSGLVWLKACMPELVASGCGIGHALLNVLGGTCAGLQAVVTKFGSVVCTTRSPSSAR